MALGGCAALACQPATIEVAKKEVRSRVENASGGLYRTTGTGRLEPAVVPRIVREYWLVSRSGTAYRVSRESFEAAAVGDLARVCR